MFFAFLVKYDIVYLEDVFVSKQTGKTEAQKRASEKWEGKFKQRILRIPFDKDRKLVDRAKKTGESINGLLIRLIDEELKK